MTAIEQTVGVGSAGSPRPGPSHPDSPRKSRREISTGFVVSRLLVLGFVLAMAAYAAPPLVSGHHWPGLAVLVLVTGGIACLYLTRRHVPLKYLVPGTLLMVMLQLLPVLYTVQVAFTNFGDGHRGSKQDAITAIESTSLTQVKGSAEYALSFALKDGRLVFLLTDPATGTSQVGTEQGLAPLDGVRLGITGKVLSAPGYQVLTTAQAAGHDREITAFSVPTRDGAIKANGLSRAYEGRRTRHYDRAADAIVDTATGATWTADEDQGLFVDAKGEKLSQGWKVGVGFGNFSRLFGDSTILGHFLGTFTWDLFFALSTVFGTFVIGTAVALLLHGWKTRALRFYRVLVVLPYSMPAFAMLLVWRSMFNTEFGLVNKVLGTGVDWFGEPLAARFAVILINVWLGFPYIFLVVTGALQAIPGELSEAARMDGATPWQSFRKVVLPLLLVATTPLLISSFAFNFNNFNVIQLTTAGAPFPADDPSVGATDLLITYTFRIAFGANSADFGFAAAISVLIFLMVAAMSTYSFRRTRAQEDVFS
ncbi:ABC transporter permease subunit [Actinocorallia longicatena]|uniref:Maltose/maltodextrin transport system permease protein n=1 Tax=Actinocorallia longicatena TaxID=111803 RepID=A0ABP6Q6B7_9ACTN